MGNCWTKSEKLTAEFVPHDGAKVYPTVRLYGSPKSVLAAYIRFSLLQKSVPFDFVPSNGTLREHIEGPDPDGHVTLQVGSEVVSGSRETLLRFIDARFPNPTAVGGGGGVEEGTTPVMVMVTRLQHKSMLWHVERVLRWAGDLVTRGGKKAVDPSVGTPAMEIRKFARSYSELLEVMMEHAQMEETLLFPFFDAADRGNNFCIICYIFSFIKTFNFAICVIHVLIGFICVHKFFFYIFFLHLFGFCGGFSN
jgi:hypothetical protein